MKASQTEIKGPVLTPEKIEGGRVQRACRQKYTLAIGKIEGRRESYSSIATYYLSLH